jgi:hypothetical protein
LTPFRLPVTLEKTREHHIMKRPSRQLALFIAIAWGCAVGANSAHALVVTGGCANTNSSCTLQELASGGSIRVNDKLFDNWFVDDSSTVSIDLSGIAVAALDDQPGNPGLQYIANGNLSTVGLDLIDLDLRFNVTATAGLMAGASLRIDQFAFGGSNIGGLIGISEDIFAANGIDLLGEQSVFVENFSLSMALFDSIAFPLNASIVVATNIIVAGDANADVVSLDRFTQRFSQIPEPSTILLLTIGLAVIGLPKGRLIAAGLH